MSNNMRRTIFIFVAAFVVAIVYVLPTPEGLSYEGKMSLGILAAGIILWVSEAFPLGISALLLMAVMPYLKIMTFNELWVSFISVVFFFLIATYSITIAMEKTTLPERLSSMMLSWAGRSSFKVVLCFFAAVTILSSIMSNVPSCVIGMGLALAVLKANGDLAPGKSNLGKCLMIAIPWGAMVGGFCTPAGTAHNIMAINLVQETVGIEISFLAWMLVAIPAALFIVPLSTIVLVKMFPPEPVTDAALVKVNEAKNLGPINTQEKKLIVIIIAMLTLWILSTWVPAFNITAVAIFGMALMFCPGIDLLTWNEFTKGVSWNIVLMIGGVQSIATAILKSGATPWLVGNIMAGAAAWSTTQFNAVTATISAAMHCVIPSGPAIVGIGIPPLSSIAMQVGASPYLTAISFTIFATVTFVLPVDAIPLITYGKGYYKMFDMIKAGILPTVLLILFLTFIMPLWVGLIGLG